jgi:hypothetical protein
MLTFGLASCKPKVDSYSVLIKSIESINPVFYRIGEETSIEQEFDAITINSLDDLDILTEDIHILLVNLPDSSAMIEENFVSDLEALIQDHELIVVFFKANLVAYEMKVFDSDLFRTMDTTNKEVIVINNYNRKDVDYHISSLNYQKDRNYKDLNYLILDMIASYTILKS